MLLVSYAAGLWFSLKTHRDVFNPYGDDARRRRHHWPVQAGSGLPGRGGGGGGRDVGDPGRLDHRGVADIGLSQFFVGVFVVAIVGNAAEHWVAVLVAAKDKMDLAVNIALGSSAQIALFVAPVLVLLSFFVGPDPMALVFNGYELGRAAVRGADRATW